MVSDEKAAIVIFHKISAVNPRKRFDVLLHRSHLQLRGKTVNLDLGYSNIKHISVLPRSVLTSVVISVISPLCHGKHQYFHVAFQFEHRQRINVDVRIPKTRRIALGIEEVGDTPTWACFPDIMGKVSGVIVEHSESYKARNGHGSLYTSLGREDGYLFFLEAYCLFVNRPLTYISYKNIESIEFQRLEFSTRFDILFSFVDDEKEKHSILFSNIEKSEFDGIFEFLYTNKKLNVLNGEALSHGENVISAIESENEEELLGSDAEDFDPTEFEEYEEEQDEGDTVVVVGNKRKRNTTTLKPRKHTRKSGKFMTPASEVVEVIEINSSDDEECNLDATETKTFTVNSKLEKQKMPDEPLQPRRRRRSSSTISKPA